MALPLSTISSSALAEPATDVLLLVNDQCGVSTTSTSALAINNPGKVKATVSATLLQYAGVAGQASAATEPTVRASQLGLTFSFNSTLTKGYGTIDPPHDFLLQSTDAINIPDRVRVYQNFRDSDDRGTILPIATGISSSPQLTDLVYDATRQRIYIANMGLNRVEVYDIAHAGFSRADQGWTASGFARADAGREPAVRGELRRREHQHGGSGEDGFDRDW